MVSVSQTPASSEPHLLVIALTSSHVKGKHITKRKHLFLSFRKELNWLVNYINQIILGINTCICIVLLIAVPIF